MNGVDSQGGLSQETDAFAQPTVDSPPLVGEGITAQECIEIAAGVVFRAGYGIDSFLAVARDAWLTVAGSLANRAHIVSEEGQ